MIENEVSQNDENNIIIEDLNSYLNYISSMRKKLLEEGSNGSQKFYFRGQENEGWDIRPSIFRNNMLSIEAKIIQLACSRNPSEFNQTDTPFEKLAKLQHYNLSTRLLDVTLNPLVAMFFACQPFHETTYSEDICDNSDEKQCKITKKNGIVFFKKTYALSPNSDEICILSAIAELDISSGLKMAEINPALQKYVNFICTKDNFDNIVKIIQGNYLVEPNLTNERLIRQSGAFLIPGAINVNKDEQVLESRIFKCTTALNNEFDLQKFVIPHGKKEEILEELDFYNINESTLFPELEHHMNYIKSTQKRFVESVNTFSRIQSDAIQVELIDYSDNDIISSELFLNKLDEILKKNVNNSTMLEPLRNTITESAVVDWFKKESVQSQMRININNVLQTSNEYKGNIGKDISKIIMDQIIEMVFELIKSPIWDQKI